MSKISTSHQSCLVKHRNPKCKLLCPAATISKIRSCYVWVSFWSAWAAKSMNICSQRPISCFTCVLSISKTQICWPTFSLSQILAARTAQHQLSVSWPTFTVSIPNICVKRSIFCTLWPASLSKNGRRDNVGGKASGLWSRVAGSNPVGENYVMTFPLPDYSSFEITFVLGKKHQHHSFDR